MAREFSVVRALARREVEAHQKRFIGITASVPEFKDINGKLEWVVAVRVGVVEGWAVVKDVLLAQWVIGIVADMNVPVLCERSEAGRVTIIARSEVRLPDVTFTTYSHEQLGFGFMHLLEQDDDSEGVWRDGYGHAMGDPTTLEGSKRLWTWDQQLLEWGGTDFIYGETPFGASRQNWRHN